MKIPWFLELFLGLFFPIIPRVARVIPDTFWLSNTSNMVNTRFARGDDLPGVFRRLIGTGEGVGNGTSLQISCVLNETERFRCKMHGSGMDTLSMRASHVNTGIADTHERPIPSEEFVWWRYIADNVQIGHRHSSSAQRAGMIKQPGSLWSEGKEMGRIYALSESRVIKHQRLYFAGVVK